MKNINCQGKKIRVTEKMFVKKDGILGKVLVCESCPYANENSGECKNCYGRIALVEVDIFDTKLGDYVPNKNTLRDRFIENDKDIIAKLDATDYINSCDVISVSDEDKKDNVGSMSSPWYYGERPTTWKTDCKTCKSRYGDNVPCKDVKGNKEKGLPDHFCGEQRQRILKFF